MSVQMPDPSSDPQADPEWMPIYEVGPLFGVTRTRFAAWFKWFRGQRGVEPPEDYDG